MEKRKEPTEEVKTLVRYLIEAEELSQSIKDIRNEGLNSDSVSNLFYNIVGTSVNLIGAAKKVTGYAAGAIGKKVGLGNYISDKTAPSSLAQLLRDGLLSELSNLNHQTHLNNIFSGLMSWAPIADKIISLGIDKDSFPLLMTMLRNYPIKADKIGTALADLIENPDNPDDLKIVVNNIIELSCDKRNSTNARLLIDHIIRKCNNNLPIVNEKISSFDEKLSFSDLSEEAMNIIKKEKDNSLTVMDNLTIALKDFMPVLMDLNNKELLDSIINHSENLQNIASSILDKEVDSKKDTAGDILNLLYHDDVINALTPLITKDLITKALKLPQVVKALQFDSSDKQVYADAILSLTEILNNNPDKFKAIIIAAKNKDTKAIIEEVIETISLGSEEQKDKLVGLISHLLPVIAKHKYPEVPKEVKAIEKQLDDPYVQFEIKEDLAKQKKTILAKAFSAMDIIAYQCSPFNKVIADLNDPEFLKSALKHPKQLKEVNETILKFVFESNNDKESGQHLKEMVRAISELITQKDVAEKAGPLFLKNLVTDVFNLPKCAGICHYQKLVEDLAEDHPEKFKELAGGLLELPEELKRSLEATIDFINLPPPPRYTNIRDPYRKTGYREVGLYIENEKIMYKIGTEHKELALTNKDSIDKVYDFLNDEGPLSEDLQKELYAVTHAKEKSIEDPIFDNTIANWIEISTKPETLPIVLSVFDTNLVENIFELPKLKGIKTASVDTKSVETSILSWTAEMLKNPKLLKQALKDISAELHQLVINVINLIPQENTKSAVDPSNFQVRIARAIHNLPAEKLQKTIQENKAQLIAAFDKILDTPGIKKTTSNLGLGLTGEEMVNIVKDTLNERSLRDTVKFISRPSASRAFKLLEHNFNLMGKVCKYMGRIIINFAKSLNPFKKKDVPLEKVSDEIEIKKFGVKRSKTTDDIKTDSIKIKPSFKTTDDLHKLGTTKKEEIISEFKKLKELTSRVPNTKLTKGKDDLDKLRATVILEPQSIKKISPRQHSSTLNKKTSEK